MKRFLVVIVLVVVVVLAGVTGLGFYRGWFTLAVDKDKIEVIAGVNLPMLIKLASVRNTEGLEEAVASAQEAGRKYINVASTLLKVGKGPSRT